jgi:hypothetical protein
MRPKARTERLLVEELAGAAAGGLILVHSIAAPTPAMAASVQRQNVDECKWVHEANGSWSCIAGPAATYGCRPKHEVVGGIVFSECAPVTS